MSIIKQADGTIVETTTVTNKLTCEQMKLRHAGLVAQEATALHQWDNIKANRIQCEADCKAVGVIY